MNRKYVIAGVLSALLLGSLMIAVYLSSIQSSTIGLAKTGQIDTGGQAEFVEVVGDIAYVVDVDEDSPGGLVLIDISDPTEPVEISSFNDGGRPFEFAVADGLVFLADAFEGLEIINVSDPENPEEIYQYNGSGAIYDVQIVEDIAYVADWNWGMIVLNISDPVNPELLANKPITGACIHVHVDGDLVYASDHRNEETGIVVYNISNPANPIQVGSYLPEYDIWNPFVRNGLIYTGNHEMNGGELRILNSTIQNDIEELGILDPGGTIFSIVVHEDLAYMADYQLGLIIADVSDPATPRLVRTFYDGGHAKDVCVVGDLIFVADGEDGLEIIQMSTSG